MSILELNWKAIGIDWIELKYGDSFDNYWFVLYISPKFETDPKRKGINDIVELWGRTFSFIKMIKCCTCRYTFKCWKCGLSLSEDRRKVFFTFFLQCLNFIRLKNLSYQPKKNKTIWCILFHYIAVENIQIKNVYRWNEMTFSHLAHFWKPIYFWIHSIWLRIKSVMCNSVTHTNELFEERSWYRWVSFVMRMNQSR